ncbi:hypothetical protein R9X47_22740 [Wukongibacter baidiensis]
MKAIQYHRFGSPEVLVIEETNVKGTGLLTILHYTLSQEMDSIN